MQNQNNVFIKETLFYVHLYVICIQLPGNAMVEWWSQRRVGVVFLIKLTTVFKCMWSNKIVSTHLSVILIVIISKKTHVIALRNGYSYYFAFKILFVPLDEC